MRTRAERLRRHFALAANNHRKGDTAAAVVRAHIALRIAHRRPRHFDLLIGPEWILRVLVIDAQHNQTFAIVLLVQLFEGRQLRPARPSPACPEIEHYDLAAQGTEPVTLFAFESGQLEIELLVKEAAQIEQGYA